ncbi:MAG TPA: hypothetical protein VHC43_09920 [Mycobacteriales bacterium]|nr:hypothetical protein [Mycobacteriales bacterium]
MTALDIDEVVVDRLVAGEPVDGANDAERARAAHRLMRGSLSETAIARRLGVKPWRVQWLLNADDRALATGSACAGPDCPYCQRRRRLTSARP